MIDIYRSTESSIEMTESSVRERFIIKRQTTWTWLGLGLENVHATEVGTHYYYFLKSLSYFEVSSFMPNSQHYVPKMGTCVKCEVTKSYFAGSLTSFLEISDVFWNPCHLSAHCGDRDVLGAPNFLWY